MGSILNHYIVMNDLGVAFAADTGFVLETNPDTVRAPDFAFVTKARVPNGQLPEGYFRGPPDLAVEILSPHDLALEVEDKTQQWLDAGTIHVWVVNLKRSTITVHAKNRQPRVCHAIDVIDGGVLLPGFAMTVEELLPPI